MDIQKKIDNPFKEFITKFFDLRLKAKKDGDELLADNIKLILNSVYGKTVQKDIDTKEHFTTKQ